MKRFVVITLFLSILFFLSPNNIDAATFSVTDQASLISAINTANSNGQADVIILENDIILSVVDNTTYGATGLPLIISDITIYGNNFTIQRNGACGSNNFRLMAVENTGTLSLYNVGLAGGCAIGGSFPDGMGGAIYNLGTISTIAYSTIANNTGDFGGGGIVNRATIGTITNSTFTGNDASNGNGGGAILNFNGTITTIQNTTFENNIANDSPVGRDGAAIYSTGGSASIGTIANVTFTNNASNQGGALANTATISTIQNTLIVNNTSGNCGLGISSGTDNISSDASCTGFTTASVPTLTLGSNGGPTQTTAITTGTSPDNAGGGSCLLIDQRALIRTNAPANCDVGAFELGISNFITPVVNFASATSNTLEGSSHLVTLNLEVGAVSIGDTITVMVIDALTGSATSSTDYTAFNPTTVTFNCSPATPCTGTVQTTVQLDTLADATPDAGETVDLQIMAVTGPAEIGTVTQHTVTILEASTVTLVASDPDATENPADNGQFTVDLGLLNGTGLPITVSYTIAGTADNGVDYVTLTGTVDIPNGQQTATIDIVPLDDSELESTETITLTLTGTNNALISVDSTAATVNITDDEIIITPPITQPSTTSFDPAINKLGFASDDESIEWIITVSNTGSVIGENIVVTDILPAQLTILDVIAPNGSVSINGQTVTVTYPTLNIGEIVQFSIFTTSTITENTACVNASNQAVEECVTAMSVGQLPNTGEHAD